MKADNVLMAVAAIAVLVSVAGMWVSYNSVNNVQNILTGYLTITSRLNITVAPNLIINYSVNLTYFGSGVVTSGLDNATLYTNGTVAGGSWAGTSSGLVLENLGNVNVSIQLQAGANNTGLIGGTAGGGPQYQWTFNNSKAGSCVNNTGGNPNNTAAGFSGNAAYFFVNVNNTSGGTWVCNNFSSVSDKNQMRIDFYLVVPRDSKTGGLTDTITTTYAQSSGSN